MDKKIQLFSPYYSVVECLEEIKECLEVGWTGIGFKTNKFEEAWKSYTGLPNAHFLNSNTAGLYLALSLYKEALGWRDEDEIISTPLTFISTNHAILYTGLRPVFADIDDTLCLSPESIQSKITSKTRAIMYVGFGGNAGRLNEIKLICKDNNLILILDAAHMAGTKYQGKHIGQEIDCTVFSFQAVKNLPTADSGMICFQDPEFDKEARKWSWLGINQDTYARSAGVVGGNYKWLYNVEYIGYKAHGNSVIASIGIVQLKYLDEHNAYRRKLSEIYEKYLSENKGIRFIKYYPDCIPSRHLFQIRVDKRLRNELIVYLNSKNIYPGVHYRINTDYKMYKYGSGTCPNAEEASQELISLPLHMRLTEEDIKCVCDQILEFLNGK